jgi:hypothetical protein
MAYICISVDITDALGQEGIPHRRGPLGGTVLLREKNAIASKWNSTVVYIVRTTSSSAEPG